MYFYNDNLDKTIGNSIESSEVKKMNVDIT